MGKVILNWALSIFGIGMLLAILVMAGLVMAVRSDVWQYGESRMNVEKQKRCAGKNIRIKLGKTIFSLPRNVDVFLENGDVGDPEATKVEEKY